jgi:hypothetical protein
MTSRRALLKAMSLAPLAGIGASACTPLAGTGIAAKHYTPSGTPLRRVRVADERVIRTVVGLRPYRPSGFVVAGERKGNKLLIHNYGHGGGGITLSWGSSSLAADIAGPATQANNKRCAIIGCGVMGLTSARLMQDRGWQVTIYSKDLPPNTTSNIAGGQWSPASVYDPDYLTPGFQSQFADAMARSYRYFQNLAGPKYGVRWISNYQLSDAGPVDDEIRRRYPGMFPQLRELDSSAHPFPLRYATHFDTMLIEPAVFLPQLMQEFYGAGGSLMVREFTSEQEILSSLEEPVVINCTGLGAGALFGDEEIRPVKGQLSFILPQEEVQYIIIADGIYMFPRSDGILLGGTFEEGEWSLQPDPAQTRRILNQHRAFFDGMADPWSASA